MRVGVVVVVRAPGPIVRRLVVRDLRVRRAPGARLLELRLANRGNVTESLALGAVRVALRRRSLDLGLGPTGRRMIRPRTEGVVQIACPRFLRGWLTATVQIASEPGRPAARRTFRVRCDVRPHGQYPAEGASPTAGRRRTVRACFGSGHRRPTAAPRAARVRSDGGRRDDVSARCSEPGWRSPRATSSASSRSSRTSSGS
jgi:hypothetical protein